MEVYQPGTMIGNYEVVSKPMMGGMGVVYFCLDHGNNKKPVALKTFRPELLPDREARDRFLREGTAWVNLGRHPHIVRCYKVEYIDPTAFLVLELIAKEQGMEDASLRSWMGSPMKVEQALLFALQIARGMQHATEEIPGFVHRDLKPENILVGADKLPNTNINRLRVTDFGLSTMLQDESGLLANEDDGAVGRTHLTQGVVGTPLYMAPEQWRREDVGVYTDVYALGCILYEMLTAKRVVDGQSIHTLYSAHCGGRLTSMPDTIPSQMKTLLGNCLSLNSAERYQSWGDVAQSLEQTYTEILRSKVPSEVSTTNQTSLEEQMQEGWSYNLMGLAYSDIDKPTVSISYFEKALEIARRTGDQHGEAAALGNLGSAYYRLGEIRQAIKFYEQDLAIARETRNRYGEGTVLGNLGTAYLQLGEVRKAIGYYEQAMLILREMGNRSGRGAILGNLGAAYFKLGETRKAIWYYEQQLDLAHEAGERRVESAALGNLGTAYVNIGEVRQAIEYYEQQLEINRNIGNRGGESNALGNLGVAYKELGELRRAIEFYKQHLAIACEIGDRIGEGNALGNLGTAHMQMREVQPAIGYYEKTLSILREVGDRLGEGIALGNLGAAYLQFGEVQRSISCHEQQIELAREIGDRLGEGYALSNLGFVYASLGETQLAIGYYEQALVVDRETSNINGTAKGSFNVALLYARQGEKSRALTLAKTAEKIWSQTGNPNLQTARRFIADLQGN